MTGRVPYPKRVIAQPSTNIWVTRYRIILTVIPTVTKNIFQVSNVGNTANNRLKNT